MGAENAREFGEMRATAGKKWTPSSQSDDAVAFLEHWVIKIESLEGKILGTFKVNITQNDEPHLGAVRVRY